MAGSREYQLEYIDPASGRTCVDGGAAEPPVPVQPVSRQELKMLRQRVLSLERRLRLLKRTIVGHRGTLPPG